MKPNHIEDNRLQGMSDKYNGAYYGYDATGERSLKLTGQTIHVNQNGQDYHIPVFDKQTLYASPLITINDEGYTKHYFEEGKRICSKIGSGELHNVNDILDGISDRAERLVEEQQFGVEKSFEICMGMYSSVKTYNLKEHIIQPYENPIHPDEPIFYYHSDHLGSASFLTDETGIQTQQLVYLPFGEDWVDLKYNTQQFETPYKFNGKEKDLESGYNYYGARYYYDWLSIWLSVDPLSDKYPHLTSYNYCANNPVMLVDPDGRDYDLAINHNDRTITISAVYFADDRSYESAVQATNYWNNKSDNYSYRVKQGNSQIVYRIKFDLQVIRSEDYNESYIANTNKNVYQVVNDNDKSLPSDVNGRTSNYHLKIKESRKKSRTGAHEVGHTLGLDHYLNGIMTKSDKDPNRTDRISKDYIEDIFNNAFNRNPDGNNVGIGTIKEEGTAPHGFNDRRSNEIFNNLN